MRRIQNHVKRTFCSFIVPSGNIPGYFIWGGGCSKFAQRAASQTLGQQVAADSNSDSNSRSAPPGDIRCGATLHRIALHPCHWAALPESRQHPPPPISDAVAVHPQPRVPSTAVPLRTPTPLPKPHPLGPLPSPFLRVGCRDCCPVVALDHPGGVARAEEVGGGEPPISCLHATPPLLRDLKL